MARLFRRKSETKKGFWKRVVDLALTDVRVAVRGIATDSLEAIEESLIAADFGVPATLDIVDHLENLQRRGDATPDTFRTELAEKIREILDVPGSPELEAAEAPPTVILLVGVNGVGKTTTVAKLAHRLVSEGRSVLLAAADTFRAGAVEQLRIWSERVGAEFVGGAAGGDPAAVAFDAIDAAISRNIDVVLIDTAGRLHTRRDLMTELEKVDRVIRKRLDGAPHETLLVLDATVGQNAIRQVESFGEIVPLTGIVLAKLDSSAKGGVVVALAREHSLPVKLVGTGEGVDDLSPFDAGAFVDAVLAES